MSTWGARKARVVLGALLCIGWRVKRQTGSHVILERLGWPDYVFAFHDRDEIGLLLFPNGPACRSLLPAGVAENEFHDHPALIERIAKGIADFNRLSSGSSTRISRFVLLKAPPQAESHEITDKGYLNQRAVLTNRAKLVEELFRLDEYAVSP